MGASQHLEVNRGLDYKKVQSANPQSNKRRQVIAKASSKDNIMMAKNIQ